MALTFSRALSTILTFGTVRHSTLMPRGANLIGINSQVAARRSSTGLSVEQAELLFTATCWTLTPATRSKSIRPTCFWSPRRTCDTPRVVF